MLMYQVQTAGRRLSRLLKVIQLPAKVPWSLPERLPETSWWPHTYLSLLLHALLLQHNDVKVHASVREALQEADVGWIEQGKPLQSCGLWWQGTKWTASAACLGQ